jgi:uncharacterized protein
LPGALFHSESKLKMFKIVVDADSNPVKQDIFRVARRYRIKITKVILVANSLINTTQEDWLEQVVVSSQLDAADDWIVDHIDKNDIVITGDIPLAARCMKKYARVLSPKGIVFTTSSMGNALATRDLMTHLRDIGINTGGPAAFEKKDHSRFLQALDTLIQSICSGK